MPRNDHLYAEPDPYAADPYDPYNEYAAPREPRYDPYAAPAAVPAAPAPAPATPAAAPADAPRPAPSRDSCTRRRGRSPRRGRTPADGPRGELYLQVGKVRSDARHDTTLRWLTRAHRDNEQAVISMMRATRDHAIEVTTPEPVSQRACDAAFQLMQLGDDAESRAQARALLSELAQQDPEALVDAVLVLMRFTRAHDILTRSGIAHAMLASAGDDAPRRLLDGAIAARAVAGAGDTLMACALHVAFGIDTLAVADEDAGGALALPEGATDELDITLEEVAELGKRLSSGGFADHPAVQYDLPAVHALATMVAELNAEEDERHERSAIFLGVLDRAAPAYHAGLKNARQAQRYKRACEQIARVLGADEPIEWSII